MREPKKLLIAGDWHGSGSWAQAIVQAAKRRGVDTIVHLGDFGVWPGREGFKYLRFVDHNLEECGIDLYVVPGNHEDYSQLGVDTPGREPFSLRVETRTTFLPRGYRWSWWGQTWMSVGGAHSVDRLHRTEDKSWWPGELLTEEQAHYCQRAGHVDVVVAHDVPLNVTPPNLRESAGSGWPESEIYMSDLHRKRLQSIQETLRPSLWFHGHHHIRYDDRIGRTRVHGLDCDGSSLFENALLMEDGKVVEW